MSEERLPVTFGFRSGDRGTHSSRTMMLAELSDLLAALPPAATNADYRRAVIEENTLGKRSVATRRLTIQRLSELYALDPDLALFRNLRRLWPHAGLGRPTLALLCASARDPLLRLTAAAILHARAGAPFSKTQIDDALAAGIPGRFNPSTRNKVARNAASSWTQSGHLTGRTQKIRSRPRVSPESVSYALFLGFLCDLRGPALFSSLWSSLLDRTPEELLPLAEEASAAGLMNLRRAGSIIDVSFPGWLTHPEEETLHEPH